MFVFFFMIYIRALLVTVCVLFSNLSVGFLQLFLKYWHFKFDVAESFFFIIFPLEFMFRKAFPAVK